MAKSSIKSGKPIGRQQAARKRRHTQIMAYFRRLHKRKHAQVKKSNGIEFAKEWIKKYPHAT